MSSFLHSAKHFNSIEISLIELKKKNESYYGFLRNIKNNEISDIIDIFRTVSCFTVNKQYCEHYSDVDGQIHSSIKKLFKDKKTHVNLNPIELYKAIDSMEYQIEYNHLGRELTEIETNSIKLFNVIKFQLADLIINNLSEYDNAKSWSIF